MLIILYICIVFFSVLQSAAAKLYNRQSDNASVFNAVKALFALVLFGAMSIGGFGMHIPTAVYGALYGLSLCVSMYSGYKALCSGPMSLTSLIVSFSVVIPLIYGIGFCGEELTAFKIAGLAFLVLAIVFVNMNKAGSGNNKVSYGKWMVFVMLTFVTNGICSVLQKMHQSEFTGRYLNEFMIFSMLLCTLIFFFAAVIKGGMKEFGSVKGKRYGCLAGISNAVSNYCTLALAGFENASVLYPTISAGTILVTLLFAVALFGEKLRYNQWLALGAGVVAVVFLKI